MNIYKVFLILSISIGAFLFQSCQTQEENLSCFPQSQINVNINVYQPLYTPLQNIGGYVYIDLPQAGTRGLIVVRVGENIFKAYDRNAPHLCPADQTTLYVKNGTTLVCDADNSEWILLTGQPVKVADRAPKTYPVNFNPNTGDLSILY